MGIVPSAAKGFPYALSVEPVGEEKFSMGCMARCLKVGMMATLTALNASCLAALLGDGDHKSNQYFLPSPGKAWVAIDPAEADAAYRNKADDAVLSVSSLCSKDRFHSLEDLAAGLLDQLPDRRNVAQPTILTIAGYPALRSQAMGTVDGETLQVQVAIIRTPQCVYDFFLAGKTLSSESRQAFDRLLGSFRLGGNIP